jgi:hypothetical protein
VVNERSNLGSLGHAMIAHLEETRSMEAQLAICCNLMSCG